MLHTGRRTSLALAGLAVLVAWQWSNLVKVTAAVWAVRYEPDSPAFYDGLVVLQKLSMPWFPLATCMNYGWAGVDPPAELAPELASSVQPCCLQMYDVVVRAAAARSFDAEVQAEVGTPRGGLLRGLDVIEVGCGRGGGAHFLAAHHEPLSMVGVDASAENIAEAERQKRVLDGDARAALRFTVGNAEELPLGSETADLVLNVESLHTYDRPLRFVDEVFRVLRPGGVFVVADRGLPRMTPQIMSPLDFIRAGFVLELHRPIHEGVARSISANTYFPELVASIPSWLFWVLGPGFKTTLEAFVVLPGSRYHHMFADGRMRYELHVYSKRAVAPEE